jgi:hypothetical protein
VVKRGDSLGSTVGVRESMGDGRRLSFGGEVEADT